MTSRWYAIADAGGNIYPGTFAKAEDVAINLRVWEVTRQAGESHLTSMDIVEFQRRWDTLTERGDRPVFCQIETNEQVKTTILP